MKHIKPITWIAALDKKQANFYVQLGRKIEPAFHTIHAESRNSDDSGNNLGRTFSSKNLARHIIEPHTSEKTLNAKYFAKSVAIFLKEALRRKHYDWLVLVAPPEMLGFIRKALDTNVRDTVIRALDKDFMRLSPQQIEEHLVV
jgi:protein required for attachment to host cells